jgi:hypothetical protein
MYLRKLETINTSRCPGSRPINETATSHPLPNPSNSTSISWESVYETFTELGGHADFLRPFI